MRLQPSGALLPSRSASSAMVLSAIAQPTGKVPRLGGSMPTALPQDPIPCWRPSGRGCVTSLCRGTEYAH